MPSHSPDLAPLHCTLERLASQSASCKIWSIVLVAAALLFAIGRPTGPSLLWASTPVVVLAFMDACYLAQARRIVKFASRSDTSDEHSSADFAQFRLSGGDFAEAFKSLASLFSFNVWPFYLVLAGLIAGLSGTVLNSKSKAVQIAPELMLQAPPVPSQSRPYSTPFTSSPPNSAARPLPPAQTNLPVRPASPFPTREGSPPPRSLTAPRPQTLQTPPPGQSESRPPQTGVPPSNQSSALPKPSNPTPAPEQPPVK